MQHLKSLVDFSSLPCIRGSDVQQGIETAQPFPAQGMVIWADSAPDVVANAELKTFLWGQTNGDGVTPKVDASGNPYIYYFDGVAWVRLPFGVIPGSVSLSAINLTGSQPYYIIQVNSLGTALQWISIINAIQANSLTIDKLRAIGDTNDYVLASESGVTNWILFSDIINTLLAGSIDVSKLKPGAANLFLRVDPTGTSVLWKTVDISDVLAAGSSAGQVLKRNAGNTGWTFASPGTTMVAPTLVTSWNAVGAWGTHDITGSIGASDRTSVKCVILYIDSLVSTTGGSADAITLVQSRANNISQVYDLAKARGINGAGVAPCIGQFIVPIYNNAGTITLDLQLSEIQSSGGSDTIVASAKIVGYIC